MLKVAIVGCGKIADAHAAQIARIRGCEIAGVCDREPLMAKQLFDRFPVARFFDDVTALLIGARPDVVHITTPPASHFEIARACLERGCHVYVEKPFTLRADEAERLLALADARGLRVTVGHDDQFSHAARRMRALIDRGYLGGAPVHMESHYGYELGERDYARSLLGDRQHWVRRLPGGLLQNVISHGIARIAEFLTTDAPQVTVCGFVSPVLKTLGEQELVDELRVMVCEEERTTAFFTFSSRCRPSVHQFRIFGPKNGLFLDQDQETVIKLRGGRFKSYGEKVIPSVIFAAQHLGNAAHNVGRFLARDFHMKSGMKHLFECFYRSIEGGGQVPIPYPEIMRTARIMDAIFDQIAAARPAVPFQLEERSA